MQKIDWSALPQRIKEHLIERLPKRGISQDDLAALTEWIKSDPDVPEGQWCKEFDSFTLAGEGKYPKTFLSKGQACKGTKL